MRDTTYKIATLCLVAALAAGPPRAQARQQSGGATSGQSDGQPGAQSGSQSAPVVVAPPPPAPAPAQQTPAQQAAAHQSSAVLRSSSELVRIDVEVTDKSGKPVKGLTQDKFTVTDDGKPQKISTFTYSDIESIQTAGEGDDNGAPVVVSVDTPRGVSADTVSNQVRDRRMLVLYFDFTSLETQDLLRARDAALKFVRTQMSKADLVSVVIFDQKLSVWCDFTNDHAKI